MDTNESVVYYSISKWSKMSQTNNGKISGTVLDLEWRNSMDMYVQINNFNFHLYIDRVHHYPCGGKEKFYYEKYPN